MNMEWIVLCNLGLRRRHRPAPDLGYSLAILSLLCNALVPFSCFNCNIGTFRLIAWSCLWRIT